MRDRANIEAAYAAAALKVKELKQTLELLTGVEYLIDVCVKPTDWKGEWHSFQESNNWQSSWC